MKDVDLDSLGRRFKHETMDSLNGKCEKLNFSMLVYTDPGFKTIVTIRDIKNKHFKWESSGYTEEDFYEHAAMVTSGMYAIGLTPVCNFYRHKLEEIRNGRVQELS